MTKESWILTPSRPTPMATSESPNKIVHPLLRNTYQIGTQRKPFFFSVIVKTYNNKNVIYFIFFLCCFHSKGYPRSRNWTLDFEPTFSQRFSPTLSPRSIFHIAQRFPILNHVTSGSHEPAIPFFTWSAVSHPKNHVIALDQSGASIRSQTGPTYYWGPTR